MNSEIKATINIIFPIVVDKSFAVSINTAMRGTETDTSHTNLIYTFVKLIGDFIQRESNMWLMNKSIKQSLMIDNNNRGMYND